MAAAPTDDERLVRDWLCRRGYYSEYEPVLVEGGRRPDFLAVANNDATTPNALWAEVKSLDPEKTSKAISRAWPSLKTLAVPEKLNGYAILYVGEATREQSVRALIKMFYGKARGYSSEKSYLIFVQHCGQGKDIRYVEVEGPVVQRVWARGAGEGKIAVPLATVEDGSATVRWERDGIASAAPAFKVFDWLLPFDCALVANIDPADNPLTSITAMADGSSTVAGRVLNELEDANRQLRNAYTFKAAPGVVFIVPSEAHVADRMVAEAAYGRLAAPIDQSTGKLGDVFYGRDGAFRRDKNTHISAAIRLRRSGEPATYFPNPYAREPIDDTASLLAGLRRGPVEFR